MSSAATCSCGARLAADQRYCLACGTATERALSARQSLADAMRSPRALTSAPTAESRLRLPLSTRQATELPLRAATLAFALVLGSTAWAAAEIVSPGGGAGPTTVAVAPAPQSAAAATPPPAPATGAGAVAAVTASSTEPAPEPALENPEPVSEPAATPAATGAGTEAPAADSDDASTDTTDAGDEPATDASTTPPLQRVVVLSLPPLPYEAIADPSGPAPYLAGDVAAKGALLRAFHGNAPSTLASNAALLSGQAPNAATLAGCPAVVDVTPGTIGEDDQAAGDGCRYSTDVFTVGDLLASTDRTWRTYAEDAAGAACTPLSDGAPFPAAAPVSLAFRTVTDDPACATKISSLDRLTSDLESASAPALSYVEVRGCQEDGTGCRPDDPAAVDASLRRVVPALLRSSAYGDETAVLIVPAHAKPADGTSDPAACCSDRPWVKDAATAGGGRTGALVLSPLVRPGSVIDGSVDHLDALKTVALSLDVRAPGYAGREEVKGFPRETWERWTPKATTADDGS